jgi:hypothetical protein
MDDGTVDFDYRPSYVMPELHDNYLNRSKVYPDDIF